MLEEEDPLRWKLVLPRINQVKSTEAVFLVNTVNNKDLLKPSSEGGRSRENIGQRRDFSKVKRREQKPVQVPELRWPGLGQQ